MHIALLTDGIYPYTMGGMQKHSYYLAKHLAQKCIHVDVYHAISENEKIPSFKNEYSPAELQYIRLIPIPFPLSNKYPGHYIKESYIYSKRIYKEFLKNADVDFVYIQGFSGWELLNKIKPNRHIKKSGFLTGINFHGVEMFQKAPSLRVKLEHLLLKSFVKLNLNNADYVFSLGGKLTSIQKRLLQNPRIIELPIGITNDWLNFSDVHDASEIRKFVFVGRSERRKGIEELNKVLIQLIREGNCTFECHFIGPIPENKQIIGQSNIIYHGAIHEEARIKEILQNSDVLICPSWSEGMPTVILEAMASGCAIIATDVGAVSEQVDETNGRLITAGSKNELKQAIIQMLTLPNDQLKEMKQASRTKTKKIFLWENVIENTINLIDKAIQLKNISHNN